MRPLMIGLFLSSFLAGLVLFTPLAVVLRLSGSEAFGVKWSSVTGTLSGGRVSQLRANGDLIGDAEFALRPSGLLRLVLEYSVTWSGPAGKGTGRIKAGPGGHLSLSDFRVDLSLAEMPGLASWIRHSGGQASLQGEMIRFSEGRCKAARGTVSSDALNRNAAYLGPGWSDLSGDLRCEAGNLIIPMVADNTSGTRINAQVVFGAERGAGLEAAVRGPINSELRQILPLMGFQQDDTGFAYQQQLTAQGHVQ